MNIKLFSKTLIVVPIVVVIVHFMGDFLAIDSCLDSGRAYDYKSEVCGTEQHYDPIPYSIRYWWLLFTGAVTIVIGVYLLTKTSKATPKSAL